MTSLTQSRLHRIGRTLTVATTSIIKLVGLAAAFKELFIDAQPQPIALALSAFMMAGAQLSEEVILSLLERLLGFGPQKTQNVPAADRTETER